jgi:integrase
VARFWYCATLIGCYAGLRLGDICSLEWSCLQHPNKLIVWTDKRDTQVELPVDENLA